MTETPTTRVLLTGATGFLGQAVLERLLSAHDGVHVTAVIRPKGSTTEEYAAHMIAERRKWAPVIKAANIRFN